MKGTLVRQRELKTCGCGPPGVSIESDLTRGGHFCHRTFGQQPDSAACVEPVGPWRKKPTAHQEPNPFVFSAHPGAVACFAHRGACWERHFHLACIVCLPWFLAVASEVAKQSQKSDRLNSVSRSRASGTAGSRSLSLNCDLKILPFCPGWLRCPWLPVSRATSNLLSESGLCTL